MTFLTILITVATAATVVVLVLGIFSMVHGGDIVTIDSERWMTARVVLQAIAVLALVATYFVGS